MGKSKESDLRYVKTEELIRNIFEQMLLEKEYSQITVKELTERARINRKTFYAHHVTLDELLLTLQGEMAASFEERLQGLVLPDDLGIVVETVFECAEGNGELGERILCAKSQGDGIAIGRDCLSLGEWLPQIKGVAPGSVEDDWVRAYLSLAIIGLYGKWVGDGRSMSADRAMNMVTQLAKNGLGDFFG